MKKIVLVVLILFSNFSHIKGADYFGYPLIRISYDFNLGYTTSIGAGVWSAKYGGGPYFLYSFSNKFKLPDLRKREFINGKNFSMGLYAGIGVASFRVGVNRMIINDIIDKDDDYLRNNTKNQTNFFDQFIINKSGSYWGLEVSSMFIGVTSSGGFLIDEDGIPKFNGSIGLGIF